MSRENNFNDLNDNFKELDDNFKQLVNNNELSISSIEELMIDNLNEYEKKLRNHIEELLINNIDEKDLISKKNEIGKKKDIN